MSWSWEHELSSLTGQTDEQVAEYLNAATDTVRRLVPLWEIARLGRESGWWLASKAAASTNPFAATFHDYYEDQRFDNIDMDLQATQYVMGQLVATGVLTQEQVDAIDALANYTKKLYTELPLWGAHHVAEARSRM